MAGSKEIWIQDAGGSESTEEKDAESLPRSEGAGTSIRRETLSAAERDPEISGIIYRKTQEGPDGVVGLFPVGQLFKKLERRSVCKAHVGNGAGAAGGVSAR